MSGLPEPIRDEYAKARRLEWQTLFWMSTVVVVMYLASGGSAAMRAALIEDVLSLVPAVTWLIAARVEARGPTEKYPFGFVRVNSLAFLVSAVALTLVGALLVYGGARTLITGEHPEIGRTVLFGRDIWLGWVMIAALLYSVVVPMVLGHRKLPVARALRDKVLHTDALMQKADWQTGFAGVFGVAGIGLGLWWADGAAALFIAVSVLRDGLRNIRIAAAELLDGTPRALDSSDISSEAERLGKRLAARFPGGKIRMRESGRYIFVSIEDLAPPAEIPSAAELMGEDPDWRLGRLDFCPPGAPSRPDKRD